MLPDHDSMVLNILAFYAEATATERAEGFAWYPTAREAGENIAARHGIPIWQAVAVIATLSPQKEWNSNVAWAERVVAAHVEGRELPREGLGNSLRRAALALSGDLHDIMREDGTLKVRNFYGSIMGERAAVCIDRHAIRIAMGDAHGDPVALTDARYRAVAAAYRDAAAELHKSASAVQAVTWTVCKRLRDQRALVAA
jgi:hypothetical protein